MQNKRKRAASEAEVKQIKSKATKTDESSSADAQSNKAGKDFDLDKFMIYRKREKAGIYAKRHFIDGRKLFEFHVQRLRSTSNKRCPLWSALTTEQKAAWQLLLAALHQGSKEPVGDQGKELLETQRAKHSGASAPVVDSPSSSSSSDDSESDHSESDDDTSDHASSAKDSAISVSSSQTKETSKAHETFRPVKRKGGWTEEENKVLLKGLHQSWSNERIQAELPPTSVRTLAAISTAKSIVKKRHSINPPPFRAKPSLALPASTSTASSSKRSSRPDQSSTPEPQSIVSQGSRIETPRSPITTSQKDQPGAVQLPVPQRQSVLDNEQRPDSASSGAPYLICTPQHTSSVRWLVYTSVDRPSPTFIHFEHRPPRTDETRNLRYLMLPVETPECPIINPSAEDVTNACKLAFDKAAAFRSAQKLGDTLWTVSFDRSGTSLVPMRRLMETVVRFRDFRFSARWLSIRPPRTFVADIPQEGVTATSNIVAAIQCASRFWKSLPQLALHRPQANQSRKIVAQFASNSGLVQFYVPVRMGSSQRWLHIRFEPLSLGLPCWHCEGSHEDGWCDKAEPLPYPER
ncbi:hypothetical protein CBER1_10270 [Cercospora berteroae]|uniref:Uncharacterized protein n=1 Tax=Cercospora berteroae TaxID=357750 RepID=A0A2S6BXV5_9PEZI|nr:hypothetical protein CBER1_10270 [Cercospora berteroae]